LCAALGAFVCPVDSVLECEQMFSKLLNELNTSQMFDKLRLLAPVASFEIVTGSGTKIHETLKLSGSRVQGLYSMNDVPGNYAQRGHKLLTLSHTVHTLHIIQTISEIMLSITSQTTPHTKYH